MTAAVFLCSQVALNRHRTHRLGHCAALPGFGSFILAQTGDAFLDVSSAGQRAYLDQWACAWALLEYRSAGHAVCAGAVAEEGKNEVVVFDCCLPGCAAQTLVGRMKPISGWADAGVRE